VTIPAVPPPEDGSVRTPLDFKLKPGWSYEMKSRTFTSGSGEKFSPRGDLPRGSRIVYKTPKLAQADPSALTEHERELRRYMQVILPHGESPGKYVQSVRAWPSVEDAHAGPDVSLPGRF
jgi:hypothetical protein